jgi:uncharacterized protein YlxW (UPF0749 family)
MSRSKELTKKLKEAGPELSAYLLELEKENLRLQKQVAKLQVKIISKDNEIKALKQAIPKFTLVIQSPEKDKE